MILCFLTGKVPIVERAVTLPRCQSPIEKSDPNPPQQQEENHERERKRKPGAEIDDVTVWKVTTRRDSSPKFFQQCHPVVDAEIKKKPASYLFS